MKDVFTGLSLKIQGHLKIYEYADVAAVVAHKPTRKLLDRRNAVHKDNAAIWVAKSITNRANSRIAYMVFGNGGTTVDPTGTVDFNSPHDTGLSANLYNPIFFQLVDDTIGALAGNQMAARHISGSAFTDADIRCFIDATQPFGQLSANDLTGININTEKYFFDEIGLKMVDGTLLTHVVFTPILKTASSILEVVYTLRMAIRQEPWPNALTFFSIDGVEAIADLGIIEKDFPLIGQSTTTDLGSINVTSVGISQLICDSDFVYHTTTSHSGGVNLIPALDKYGTNYIVGGKMMGVSNTGTELFAWTNADVVSAINTWAGSIVAASSLPGNVPLMTPTLDGEYILCNFVNGILDAAFAVLLPNPIGAPTILGWYWYDRGPFGLPYLGGVRWYLTNNQTINDPLLFMGSHGIAGPEQTFGVLPSINDFIVGTYAGGYAGGYGAYQIKQVTYNYIGTENLSTALFFETSGGGEPVGGPQGGFTLPDGSGGTNFYLYFNRNYMEYCGTAGPSFNKDVEVRNVLYATYPDGVMLKIALGTLNYATMAVTGGQTSPMYTVDNANWRLSGLPTIPFTDEWHYQSTGLPGGTDIYRMQPAAIIPRDGGTTWWVIFYMPGISDASVNFSNLQVNGALRIFSYNPSTNVADQVIYHSCEVYNTGDIPVLNFSGAGDNAQIVYVDNSLTIWVVGYLSSLQTAYYTEFGTLS